MAQLLFFNGENVAGIASKRNSEAEQDNLKDDNVGAQHWVQAENHHNFGVTPFGLPEVRMLLAGGSTLPKLLGVGLKV